MKMNTKVFLLGLGLLLAGCSTTKKEAAVTSAGGNPLDQNAKTSGLGPDEPGFGSANGARLNVGEQTYYFDYDKSLVRESDEPSIKAQSDYLSAHPEAKVVLEGHTDPRGSREYNVALGERRAKAVEQRLTLQGASNNQIRTVSYGAEHLASQGHTEDDYQLDRRSHLAYEAK